MTDVVQWFKNGDHPQDGDEVTSGEFKGHKYEGKVVRYYRHPGFSGNLICPHCAKTMHWHGWIDSGAEGRVVCPGDWIITVGGEHYPLKPDVFEAINRFSAVEI